MKAYVKPELFVESYELSQHIAACGIDVNYADTAVCLPSLDPGFWNGLNLTVFSSERECNMVPEALEVYCETVGASEAGKTFNS